MSNRKSWLLLIAAFLIAVGGLFFITNFTTPDGIGSLGILGTFLLIYVLFFVVIISIYKIVRRIFRIWRSDKLPIELRAKALRRRMIFISAALAFVPLFLICLNSIGQLELRDWLLIVLIEIVAIFYIVKRA
jgi:hypothetical protein